MEDEKTAALAAFDTLKADLTALHQHADRIGDASLTAAVDTTHADAHAAWTSYLAARGWEDDAASANRSGGEDKPPKPPEEDPGP